MSLFASLCLIWWPVGQPVLSHDFWCVKACVSNGFGFLNFTPGLWKEVKWDIRGSQGRFQQMEVNCLLRREEAIELSSHSQLPLFCLLAENKRPLPATVPHLPLCLCSEPTGQLSSVQIQKLNKYSFLPVYRRNHLLSLFQNCPGLVEGC